MAYYDDFKSERFRNAVAIGNYADNLFRDECKKRGLDPHTATLAKISSISAPKRGSMSEDDILNLWYQGLTRPEIVALGCNFEDFKQTIRRARDRGDSRAYYREGKSRLPWTIGNPPKEPAMEKKPPFTPRPKRTTGDVGPTFVGRLVDGLVAVLPQIDEAKRQLDRKFYARSDVLRDNKD